MRVAGELFTSYQNPEYRRKQKNKQNDKQQDMKVEEEEETSNTSNESFVDPISENHGHEIREHGREPVR